LFEEADVPMVSWTTAQIRALLPSAAAILRSGVVVLGFERA
jgi:hypothetical protein